MKNKKIYWYYKCEYCGKLHEVGTHPHSEDYNLLKSLFGLDMGTYKMKTQNIEGKKRGNK